MTTPASYRKRAKLTQSELASHLGVTKSLISHFEADRRLLGFENFANWCDILHLTEDEIIAMIKIQQNKRK